MEFTRSFESKDIDLPSFVPKGCEAGYNILMRELKKGKDTNILVYYDPDIDGLMSGLIAQSYLEQLGVKSRYCINNNRTHGFRLLTDEFLKSMKGGLIIAVDFSITKPEFDKILRAGVNIINIDHHEIDLDSFNTNLDYVYSKCGDAYGVILNNQYLDEPDKFRFLSGAGMVYYFMKYVSNYTKKMLWSDYAAMTGISLLSDIRELESPEAFKFLNYAFSLHSHFLQYLIEMIKCESSVIPRFRSFGVPRISREFIDFEFSPIFNAMLRADLGDTCVKLLKGDEKTFVEMCRYGQIFTYRARQKQIISAIAKKIDESKDLVGNYTRDYSSLSVASISSSFEPVEGYNITNYVGVACSQIKDDYMTGAVFVIDENTNKSIRGSVRGSMDGVDYLGIFRKNGVPCAGHHNAFGILSCDISKIDFEQINKDIEEAEMQFKNSNGDTRRVLEVNNLSIFVKNPQCKTISTLNEFSRDNHRIFIKYTGDKENIKVQKMSDKYTKIYIDGVCIHSFDASLNAEKDFILFGYENGKYDKAVLRQRFDYDHSINAFELLDIYNKQILGK